MNADCAIAVYKNYEDAASAIQRLQQDGISDKSVGLVTHDVSGEVPDTEAIEKGEQETLRAPSIEGATKLTPLVNNDQQQNVGGLARLGSIVTVAAGEFFTQLFQRFSESSNIARTISDYQKLVSEKNLLVVVRGTTSEVEKAAKSMADGEATQVNAHYVENSKS